MTTVEPVRGHIYQMHDEEYGRLFCLAISTIPLSETDSSFLAVRVTVTNESHSFPWWVRLTSGDPAFGYVVTHDLDRVDVDELKEDLGEVSMETMYKVGQSLRRLIGV